MPTHKYREADDDDADDDNDGKTQTVTVGDSEPTTSTSGGSGVTVVPRSKSNDILKRESPSNTMDTIKSRMSHFNTLKQWGRNRLRLINRNSSDTSTAPATAAATTDPSSFTTSSTTRVYDMDDNNVYETVISKNKRKFMEKERKLSHERKPSYSSSEKSLTITSQSSHSTLPASVNPVKLRESSAIRRQRRSGLGQKDELNSSSGNWSASSESGRTSIGSEITAQPKSSASSTSLNHSHPPGSGPPSSIISRRRFLNTSASSSVTSEGTMTPDLQIQDPYDDETSSAYSCDTEGYYTSFHVDSGLKTLKEEEPVTPLHTSSALSSTNSFGSTSNKTVLSAENEYELFGKGSTSTTASSAGTVCTTLMTAGSDRCLINGPAVPERKSSLTKLNRSNSSNSNSSTLERSCSSSTVGSTLERTGTIKRNGILLKKEISVSVHSVKAERTESPDSGNNTSSSPVETNSSSSPVHGIRCNSEFEYSECSDLEGVERVERIRVKTTINSSRIPSLCVITPSNSDDDEEHRETSTASHAPLETDLDKLNFNTSHPPAKVSGQVQIMTINKETGYATLHTYEDKPTPKLELKKDNIQHVKKSTLLPLNTMLGRLRGVLPHLKKSPHKEPVVDDPIYDNAGEYVTIADVKNNNQKKQNGVYYSNDLVRRNLATVLSGNLNEETEYVSLNELPSNIRCESNLLSTGRNEQSSVAAKLSNAAITTTTQRGTSTGEKINSNAAAAAGTNKVGEYGVIAAANSASGKDENDDDDDDEEGMMTKKGARVTLDAHGKVVYNSDSLKRRKGAHTTFAPGPCVKDFSSSSTNIPVASAKQNNNIKTASLSSAIGAPTRKPTVVRPVISQSLHKPISNSVGVSAAPATSSPTPSAQGGASSSVDASSAVDTMLRPMFGQTQQQQQQTAPLGNGNLLNRPTTMVPKQGKAKLMLHVNPSQTPPPRPEKRLSSRLSQSSSSSSSVENQDPSERPIKRSNSYRMANDSVLSIATEATASHSSCSLQRKPLPPPRIPIEHLKKIDTFLEYAVPCVVESAVSPCIAIVAPRSKLPPPPPPTDDDDDDELMQAKRIAADDTTSISSKGSSRSSGHPSIAKSFEKLMDEFSLSMAAAADTFGNSSYLKSQSIENVDSSDEFFDSDNEMMFLKTPLSRHQQRMTGGYLVSTLSSPHRVTVPADGHQFRARVLSFGTAKMVGSTDIW